MDQLLAQWEIWDAQIAKVDTKIQERQRKHNTAPILATLPGANAYSSLALASRIGAIENFPCPGSLAITGLDAWLPQFGGRHRSAGVDHQGGECDGEIHSGAIGSPRIAARCVDESMVCTDQEASWIEDRPSSGDASIGDDHLAHGEEQRGVLYGWPSRKRQEKAA